MGAGGAGRDAGPELIAYKQYLDQRTKESEDASVVLSTSQQTQFLIEQSLKASLDEVVAAMNDFPSSHLDHMEVCSGPESRLTACIQQMGGKAERIGLHNNMDLTTSLGLERAREFCDVTAPRYLHLSPVCGPTSPLQELNTRTDEQREKLRKKQTYARKMSKACLQLAEEQPMRGGHMTWEWPRRNKAWKYNEVQRFSTIWRDKERCLRPVWMDAK